MLKRMFIRADRCTGCRLCEFACTLVKTKGLDPKRTRIRVLSRQPEENFPRVCLQCGKAQCIDACTARFSMHRDGKTGAVLIDQAKCDGCGKCVLTCPVKAIKQVSESEVSNCDLCEGDPTCVGYCPTGAILYMEHEEIQRILANEVVLKYRQCIG